MTAVAMGTGTAAGTENCPKTLNVTLAGATSSSWATDAIVKIAAAIKTDSDGYKITIEASGNQTNVTGAGNEYMGGCLAVGTTNPIVCMFGKTVASKTGVTTVGYLQYSNMVPSYVKVAAFTTALVMTGNTEITAAKWNRVMSGSDCSATITPDGTGI